MIHNNNASDSPSCSDNRLVERTFRIYCCRKSHRGLQGLHNSSFLSLYAIWLVFSLVPLFIPRPNHPMYVRFNLILFKVHSGCFLRFTRGWSVSRGDKGWLEALNRTRQGQQGTWGLNGLDPDREGMEKYYTIPDDKKRGALLMDGAGIFLPLPPKFAITINSVYSRRRCRGENAIIFIFVLN